MWCEKQLVSVPELELVSLWVQVEQSQLVPDVPMEHDKATKNVLYMNR